MADTSLIFELFQKANRTQVFTKGSIIAAQGTLLDHVYYVTDGLIKVTDTTVTGISRTVAIFSRNHVLPITWLLISQPDHGAIYDYQAMTDVNCYVLPMEDLQQLLKNNPEICFRLLDLTVKSYINATARVHNLQKTNVNEKVEFTLYYLTKVLGKPVGENIYEIDAAFTHQEIADLAGLSRESVSHQLSKDRYHEVFSKSNGHTLIDISKLKTESMPLVYPLSV